MRRKAGQRNYSKQLSDLFREFVQSVCRLSPKVRVEFHVPSADCGSALLYIPVKNGRSANHAFDPERGQWLRCEMLAGSHACFCLYYTDSRMVLYPVAEGGEVMKLYLPVDTAASVAEVFEFYRDAGANCRVPSQAVTLPLNQLLARYYVLVRIGPRPRLLPLDKPRLEKRLPRQFLDYLAAYLSDDIYKVIKLGGQSWEKLCKDYTTDLSSAQLEPVEEGDLICDRRGMTALPHHDLIPTPNGFLDGPFPKFIARPNKHMTATLFCEEYFRHTSEGVSALSRCLTKWSSLEDLQRKFAETKVPIPRTRIAQIRYAIELRATRYAVHKRIEGIIDGPVSFARAVLLTRAKLRKMVGTC